MARESAWERAKRRGVRGAFLGLGRELKGAGEGVKTIWTGTEGVEDQYKRALATGFGPAGAEAAGIAPPRFMGQQQPAAGQRPAATTARLLPELPPPLEPGPMQGPEAGTMQRVVDARQQDQVGLERRPYAAARYMGQTYQGTPWGVAGKIEAARTPTGEQQAESFARGVTGARRYFLGEPDYRGFQERTAANARSFGIRRAGETPTRDQQIQALRDQAARTGSSVVRKDLLNRANQLQSLTTGEQERATRVAEAQATAEGAMGKAAIPAQITAIAREGVARGASVTDMLNQWMENGVPILNEKGEPAQDYQGKLQTRPPNQQEIQEAQQMFQKMVGTQMGGAPGLRGGGDLNNDGTISKEESLYNQISATLKANPDMPAADRKRLTDERKRLEGVLFPQA